MTTPQHSSAARSIFVATLSFLLLSHGGHFYAYDTYIVYRTATQLVDHATLDLTPMWGAVEGVDGGTYGRYGIGLSFLHIVPAVVGRWVDAAWPMSFTSLLGPPISHYLPDDWSILAASLVGLLAGALAAGEAWALARKLGYSSRIAAWLVLLLVIATQFWPSARDSFPHVVVLWLLLVAVNRSLSWTTPANTTEALLAGCAVGGMGLVRPFDAALVAPVLCGFLLLRNGRAASRSPRLWRNSLACFCLPVLFAIGLIGAHNQARFGSPLLFDQPGTQSFTVPVVTGLFGLVLSSARGLLWYSPPLVLSLWGLRLMHRRRPAEARLFACLIAAFLLGYATYTHWHGGVCWGPRYITPLIPLALIPIGEVMGLTRWARILVLVSALPGVVVQILGTSVDFHRVVFDVENYNPESSPILLHAYALAAGRHLDWMVARLWLAAGPLTALAYASVASAGIAWGVAGVRRTIRAEEGSG